MWPSGVVPPTPHRRKQKTAKWRPFRGHLQSFWAFRVEEKCSLIRSPEPLLRRCLPSLLFQPTWWGRRLLRSLTIVTMLLTSRFVVGVGSYGRYRSFQRSSRWFDRVQESRRWVLLKLDKRIWLRRVDRRHFLTPATSTAPKHAPVCAQPPHVLPWDHLDSCAR